MLSTIHAFIRKYYVLPDGCYIEEYQEEILVFEGGITIKIKNRALKHIIEQRKKDLYLEEDLQRLFSDLFTILESNQFKIVDNQGTLLLLEIVGDKKSGVVLVLEIVQDSQGHYYIKTGFYRSTGKIKKLLK